MILGDRTIEQVFGRADLDKDFPMATDLVTAVQYIQVEEEIARQIGQPRGEAVAVPADLLRPATIERLASLTVLSPLARNLAEKTGKTRIQRTDIARWLFLLSFGALGLSLGIAYLLTHLYRVHAVPRVRLLPHAAVHTPGAERRALYSDRGCCNRGCRTRASCAARQSATG